MEDQNLFHTKLKKADWKIKTKEFESERNRSFFKLEGLSLAPKQISDYVRKIPNTITKQVPIMEKPRFDLKMNDIEDYCELVKKTIARKIISQEFVNNLDESGFCWGVDASNKTVVHSNECEQPFATPYVRDNNRITLLGCICMCGLNPKPMLITKRLSLNQSDLEKLKLRAIIETQSKGFLNTRIFEKWFKEFSKFNEWKKKLKNYKGLSIIMDYFNCHLTDNIKNICKDQKIIPILLVPHSSHITQPLDLS